jgi:hypothetical protein
MSVIQIRHQFEAGSVCGICLELQFHDFRNKIKEQWNRFNRDGKRTLAYIDFVLNPNLLWDEPITQYNGVDVCITHYFIAINTKIELLAGQGQQKRPGLIAAQGSLDGFMKQERN